MNAIRVVLERGGAPESAHWVEGVVYELTSGDSQAFGDAKQAPFWRSSMKPFQMLPVVADGALERLGLGDEALALGCASHHGTPRHVAIVESILDALGLEQSALACGPHRPFDDAAAQRLDEAGRRPERVHNNCSGKHAAMLALARAHGWPVEGYHEFSHPLQQHVRRELVRWLDSDPEDLDWGVDGCGVPTPALPLLEMARAYARFVASDERGPRAVVRAMTENPTLISGEEAFSTNLMRVSAGRLLGKEGAEGVFCLACPESRWGAAFKVLDGSMRAIAPAVLHALESLSLLSRDEIGRLDAFARPIVKNTRGEDVALLRVTSDGG